MHATTCCLSDGMKKGDDPHCGRKFGFPDALRFGLEAVTLSILIQKIPTRFQMVRF